MSFMSNLAANPSGSVYGQPGNGDEEDPLNLVNRLKDRENMDFQNRANFMSDLSLKQDRMKRIYDTAQSSPNENNKQPNVVMGHNPDEITPAQKADLGIKQQGLNIDSQRLAQTGKLGQESLNLKSEQEKLNQQKSDQINQTKQADMQRKIDESNKKIELAQQALESKNNNAEQTLQMHKDLAAAVEERHKLEMENMQHRFDVTSTGHQKTIDALNERIKQQGKTTTTTEVNPEGTKKTTKTLKGSAADTVQVTGKDGKTYTIPADKQDDWEANHAEDTEQETP